MEKGKGDSALGLKWVEKGKLGRLSLAQQLGLSWLQGPGRVWRASGLQPTSVLFSSFLLCFLSLTMTTRVHMSASPSSLC